MKRIYTILLIASTLFFFACQQDDNLTGGATGYLRLTVNEDMSTNSRAVPENYKPEQIAVQIVNAEGETVKETEDWELWSGKQIELPVGKYTIKASSNGFDGKDAGFDIPYYTGSKEVTITANGEANETIICKLANVKVTVNFDPALIAKVRSVAATVDNDEVPNDGTPAVYSLAFDTEETRSGYFPVTKLFASITVVNKDGDSHSMRKELTDAEGNPVKARDHFTLNIKESGQVTGDGGISVSVDPTTHEYSYTFYVSTKPTTGATTTTGVWDNLVYLKAENLTFGTGVSTEGIKFQYREAVSSQSRASEADDEGWIDVKTTEKDGIYTAFISGLTADTEYEYRLVNVDGVEIQGAKSIKTAEAPTGGEATQEQLQNAGFENWYKSGSVWYAATETDYNGGNYMWDSSNPGSGNFGINPTTQSTDVKYGGNSAAKLETQYAFIKLAAASLYYGRFNGLVGINGAKIDFGQPFTSRPIAFKGWYQYKPVAIDYVGGNQPANTVSKGDMDLCSIFIILSKGTYQVDNTKTETLLTAQNIWNNDQFIAYGELPVDQCVNTNGEWKEFNIPLQYKESQFGEQPTHLIIVCSSSKYGDYFTGGKGSTLYVDDFSLVYEGTPSIWKNK
ncbi:PCMD domain-containing protein [Phocaeicola salanitronis]|uniref:PCMD domain-containing protein n=1 Tax=Phocaeicola salanitronis TaxID=376805 RepID=UPI0025A4AEA7|nr:PCMD domain-containing protein [Phocaeicola salanitronis]MDM8306464.1 PCMD domain-containing protein [Phocaeicola salanitronis]